MSAAEVYAKKIEARLEELDAEIDLMKAKAKGAEAEAQLEYTRHLSDLREMRKDAGNKLQALREAGDDALGDVQAGMERIEERRGPGQRTFQVETWLIYQDSSVPLTSKDILLADLQHVVGAA